jgi:hypothetical protein
MRFGIVRPQECLTASECAQQLFWPSYRSVGLKPGHDWGLNVLWGADCLRIPEAEVKPSAKHRMSPFGRVYGDYNTGLIYDNRSVEYQLC